MYTFSTNQKPGKNIQYIDTGPYPNGKAKMTTKNIREWTTTQNLPRKGQKQRILIRANRV
jgi:hypothetical protein